MRPTSEPGPTTRLPLTERILASLPGRRLVWGVTWAVIPLAGAFLPSAYIAGTGEKPLEIRIATGAVFAYTVALALWAVGWFARQHVVAERSLDGLNGPAHASVFTGLSSRLGPSAAALVFVGVTTWRTWELAGPAAALAWLPVSVVINIPLMTGVWVYVALLVGLSRLGRTRLSLVAFPEDPSLGLAEVGRLAFSAFAFYTAGSVPVLLANAGTTLSLAAGLGLFIAGVIVYFVALEGIHRQLLAKRRQHLEFARRLYARAYEPVRSGEVKALHAQAEALQAAEGIERRAEGIQRWPFDDRRLRQIVALAGTVVTFVGTGVITQLVLSRLDL